MPPSGRGLVLLSVAPASVIATVASTRPVMHKLLLLLVLDG